MTISAAQCRAARGLIGWSQSKLSEAAGVSRATVTEFEGDRRQPIANNLAAIQSALEAAGVIFVAENGEGPGVRLRKDRRPMGEEDLKLLLQRTGRIQFGFVSSQLRVPETTALELRQDGMEVTFLIDGRPIGKLRVADGEWLTEDDLRRWMIEVGADRA